MSKKFSVALATTAALMFSAAPVMVAHAADAKVICEGANACKGQSACKAGANKTCKGQNVCKGQGVASISKAECDAFKAKKSS